MESICWHLPSEGLVLMEVAIQGRAREIEAAPRVLRSIDLREKVDMGDALHTQLIRIVLLIQRIRIRRMPLTDPPGCLFDN